MLHVSRQQCHHGGLSDVLKGQKTILQNQKSLTDPVNENDESANHDVESTNQFEMADCKDKQFWIRVWQYLKQTWTGVISGAEPILEDLDLPHRYRPENLHLLCEATGFSVVEMKRIYRGFKTECPTGLITEEAFHGIYSRFFPQGANVSSYSHYIFSTLDHEDSGIITFEDFVVGLSILTRGTVEEKVRWMFSLYDQDRDGYISREEMEDVVGSVFDLMGRTSDPILEEEVINERVDHIFERMDLNGDGVVSMDEFLETCMGDESITRSIVDFSNVVL